jgi:heat shock protein HslJ
VSELSGAQRFAEGAPGPAAPLEGTPWRLASYAAPGQDLRPVLPGTEVTATFEGGRLSGSAGCNRYTAGYTLGGSVWAIAIAQTASTRRFCAAPPGVMEQEAAYLAALPTATHYRIEGDRLTLRLDGGALVASYAARGS